MIESFNYLTVIRFNRLIVQLLDRLTYLTLKRPMVLTKNQTT